VLHHSSPASFGGRPIVLIGPMAVGKSAIGQQLAQQLGARFIDTDAVIVAAHGSIAEIFAGDAMGRWTAMFATRKPVYERLADITLDVRHGSIPELGGRLEAALRNYAAAKQEVDK
jgi:shikimate kinase